MDRVLADDLSRLPELLQSARDFAAREVSGLEARPVAHLGKAPDAEPLPAGGAGAEGALARFPPVALPSVTTTISARRAGSR
ncbi:aspartate aminotransferase family protein, partial [Streptomyces umbrinus]